MPRRLFSALHLEFRFFALAHHGCVALFPNDLTGFTIDRDCGGGGGHCQGHGINLGDRGVVAGGLGCDFGCAAFGRVAQSMLIKGSGWLLQS